MLTISPLHKIIHRNFENELVEILSHCAPREQSKLSTTCKAFDAIVRRLHEQCAFNLGLPSVELTNELKRTIFKYIPCYNDLPHALQCVMERYRDEFIKGGVLILEKNNISLAFTAMAPAEKGIKLQVKMGAISVGFIFQKRKWVRTLNLVVKEEFQNLFDLLPEEMTLDCKAKFGKIVSRALAGAKDLPNPGSFTAANNISILGRVIRDMLP